MTFTVPHSCVINIGFFPPCESMGLVTHTGHTSKGVTGYTPGSSGSSRVSYVGPLSREARGAKGDRPLCCVPGSSSAWCPQSLPLPAVTALGRMLSTTAESMAPAAFAPCIRACSTCKADPFTGHSGRILGLRPAPLPPRHPLQEPACLEPFPGAGSTLCFSVKDPRAAKT